MQRIRALTILLVLPFLCPSLSAAAAPAAPGVSAASAILVDGETGRVLYEKDAHTRRLIASTTKLMTALVAAETLTDLSQTVTITREDTLTEGSSMYLKIGEEVTAEELLYGLLLHSGNDAALALARVCAGDVETFVGWMNRKARALGMKDSSFANPNGLDHENHYSTAYDMALLAQACAKNECVAKMVATRSITVGTRTFTNHNKLLAAYPGCVGMKTGYTEHAGRTLVSCARREDQLLICVTLNDRDDWRDHAALYDYGFAAWPRQVMNRGGESFGSLPTAGSLVRRVDIQAVDEVGYPLGAGESLRREVSLPSQVQAPVQAGDTAGQVCYYLGNELVGETRLVYASTVHCDAAPPNSLFRRLLDLLPAGGREGILPTFSGYRFF